MGHPSLSGEAAIAAAPATALDGAAAYRALAARDARFDGIFYVGVTSTGIYCRPICPARTPKRRNCRFFATAEAAEKAAFRPCLRCRPELAPGQAPVDGARRVAAQLAQRLEETLAEGPAGLEEVAGKFGLSSRQLRRIVQAELGVSPIELLQTRRLLLAKQLLTETRLPITQVAFASGFASLRRFNDAFRTRYRMAPARLRGEASQGAEDAATAGSSTLLLGYRPPYDWPAMLGFLATRAMAGVEWISADAYHRTVQLGAHGGWIAVRPAANGQAALTVEFSHSLTPVLPALLGRVRGLFDLGARPDLIAAQLGRDRRLKPHLARHPGLRVPGAFDGFELAVRAIFGQHVSVKNATTFARRFAETLGIPLATPWPALNRLAPSARRVAAAGVGSLMRLGITRARAESVGALATAVDAGTLRLAPGIPVADAMAALESLPGIGPWTAGYIAMRALRWPDAFPRGDVGVLRSLGVATAAEAEALSLAWRPWRSYAVLHLWESRP